MQQECMHARTHHLVLNSAVIPNSKLGDPSRVAAPSLKRGAYLASSSNIANANHVYVCPTCCMFCPGATAGISVANANLPCMHALTWGRKCEKKDLVFSFCIICFPGQNGNEHGKQHMKRNLPPVEMV